MRCLRKHLASTACYIIFLLALQPANADCKEREFSNKQILNALFMNLDVKLTDAEYCEGVGTDTNDKTIGDYLSGFWAYHTDTSGRNWLDISYSKVNDDAYIAKVMIYRKNGEENWGWGVSFKINAAAKINRSSFTCLGAG